jgi:uncharacterized protein YjbJ (UPF0337 family)
MNDQHAKGTWNEVKGTVKENVGHSLGDSKTEAEGIGDRIKGKVQKGLGDVKDAVKRGVDKVLDTDKRDPNSPNERRAS